MRPTIKDVARRAGVSIATVSRILAGSASASRFTAATRDRVLQMSQEIGYTPDARASSLRSQRSRLIGVIARDITQAFPAVLIAVLDTVLKEHGYELLLAQGQTISGVDRFPEAFERHRIYGVIFVGTPHATTDTAILHEYSRRLDQHVVGLTYSGTPRLPISVQSDARLGVRLAVDHLVSLGHRRIAFAGAGVSGAMKQRLATFQEYTASIPGLTSVVEEADSSGARTGGESMLRLLARDDPPTAVMFANDEMAIGGLMAAYQSGRLVPRDLSIVGFDDIPLAGNCWPPLTTLRQPVRAMAERTVASLIGLMENGAKAASADNPEANLETNPEAHREFVFSPELVVRGSTAPPPVPGAR